MDNKKYLHHLLTYNMYGPYDFFLKIAVLSSLCVCVCFGGGGGGGGGRCFGLAVFQLFL